MDLENSSLGVSLKLTSSSSSSSSSTGIATTTATGVVMVPKSGGLSITTAGALSINIGDTMQISSYQLEVNPSNIDVTDLKNASTLVLGSYQGAITSSSTLEDFAASEKGNFWIYNDTTDATIGGQSFTLGDQLWCSTAVSGTPTDLTTDFDLVPNTISTATTTTYGTVIYGTDTPLADAQAGAVGSSTGVARIDHVHPYTLMTGATSTDAGTTGYIIAPAAGDQYHPFLGGGAYSSIDLNGVMVSAASLQLSSSATNGYLAIAGSNYYGWNASAFYPIANSAYNLGTSTLNFNEIHGNTISSASTKVLTLNSTAGTGLLQVAGTSEYQFAAGEFSPVTTAANSLGDADIVWLATYTNMIQSGASAPLILNGTSGTGYLQSAGTNIFKWSTDGLIPSTAASYDLGDTTYSFAVGYINQVSSDSTTDLSLNSGNDYIFLQIGGVSKYRVSATEIEPMTNAAYNLGEDDFAFESIYGNNIISGPSRSLILDSTAATGYLQIAGTSYYEWTAATFAPTSSAAYTLGTASLAWATGYINTVASATSTALTINATATAGYLQIAGTTYYKWTNAAFTPNASASYTLGASTLVWSTGYMNAIASAASTTLKLNATATAGYLQIAGTNYYQWTTATLSPTTTAAYTLGTAALAWSGVYANTIASATSTALNLNATSTAGYLQVAGTNYYQWTTAAFLPVTTAAYTLGGSSNVWSVGYMNKIQSAASTDLYLNGTSNNIVFTSAGTAKMIMNNAQLYPYTAGTFSLGSDSQYYYTVYSEIFSSPADLLLNSDSGSGSIQKANVDVYSWTSTAFYPTVTATNTLGTSDYFWTTVYANTITSSSDANLLLNTGTSYLGLQIGGSTVFTLTSTLFYPASANTMNLGRLGYSLQGVYTNLVNSGNSTDLYINSASGNMFIRSNGTTIAAINSNALYPGTTNAYNLGAANYVWNYTYSNQIISASSSNLYLVGTGGSVVAQTGSVVLYQSNSTYLRPGVTGTMKLGDSSYLWNQIYSTSSTISTSDERLKEDFQDIPDELLDAWDECVSITSWKWKDSARGDKRMIGTTAQSVMKAFEQAGIDIADWHIIEQADDELGTYLLCYDEFQTLELASQRRKIDKIMAQL